jgi:hypothetical protein
MARWFRCESPEELAKRRKALRRFRTQKEVDREVDRLIALELRHEDIRDSLPHESPEYWKAHDTAVKYRERARLLMPPGS